MTEPEPEPDPEFAVRDPDPVVALQRWEQSGAVWRVLTRSRGTVTVALLTCDGGEQVGELSGEEQVLAPFLAGRLTNAD